MSGTPAFGLVPHRVDHLKSEHDAVGLRSSPEKVGIQTECVLLVFEPHIVIPLFCERHFGMFWSIYKLYKALTAFVPTFACELLSDDVKELSSLL